MELCRKTESLKWGCGWRKRHSLTYKLRDRPFRWIKCLLGIWSITARKEAIERRSHMVHIFDTTRNISEQRPDKEL